MKSYRVYAKLSFFSELKLGSLAHIVERSSGQSYLLAMKLLLLFFPIL